MFLYNGTRGLFEKAGFESCAGKYNCVMRTTVEPAWTPGFPGPADHTVTIATASP